MTHYLFAIFVTATCAVVLFWIVAIIVRLVPSYWRPAGEIEVGTFTSSDANLAKDAGSALAAKLARLKRFMNREPTGFGLVQSRVLMSLPEQLQKRQSGARKRFEELNLKVKEVDVNALVKVFQILLTPRHPTLEGTVTDTGTNLEMNCDLVWRDITIESWSSSRAKAQQASETLNQLHDDILFQMLFDIPKNPKLRSFLAGRIEDDIPNWQSLQALTLGLEALELYQQTLEYRELTRAVQHLENIPIHAPGFALGHYFYAMALGEKRDERRAAGIFDQVERMTAPKTLKWSARYQRAAAMLRIYQKESAQEAITDVLNPLIAELEKIAVQSAEEQKFSKRLLPLAYAQKAYTFATLFTLSSDWKTEDLKKGALDATAQSRTAFASAGDTWTDANERADVQSWMLNTQGYSEFRIAQYEYRTAQKTPDEKTKEFRDRCEEALRLLREANRVKPNNYEVLQNQAMILDDETYDPEGDHLDEAAALYERTKRFVPDDYYQYERLARIYWRRLRVRQSPLLTPDLLKKANEHVREALTRREVSRTAAATGLYFLLLELKLEQEDTKKKALAQKVFDQAQLARSNRVPKQPLTDDIVTLAKEVAPRLADPEKQKMFELAREYERGTTNANF